MNLCFPTKSNNKVSMLEFLGGSEVARFSFFVFLDMKTCLPTIFCATCALFSRKSFVWFTIEGEALFSNKV